MVIWMCLDSWWELLSLYFYQREQERGNLILVDHSVFMEADEAMIDMLPGGGRGWTGLSASILIPLPRLLRVAGVWWPGGSHHTAESGQVTSRHLAHHLASNTAMTKGECVWATQVRHDSRYIFMFVIMFVSSTQWCMYINAGWCSPGLRGEQRCW